MPVEFLQHLYLDKNAHVLTSYCLYLSLSLHKSADVTMQTVNHLHLPNISL